MGVFIFFLNANTSLFSLYNSNDVISFLHSRNTINRGTASHNKINLDKNREWKIIAIVNE